MLRKVMHTNAEKRINIQEIREHPWYRKRLFSIDKGYILGLDIITFEVSAFDDNIPVVFPKIIYDIRK